VANRISTCSNTHVLEVHKVLPLLGVQVWDGSNYECCYEIADKRILPCAYPTSDGREMRLLFVLTTRNPCPELPIKE
jgi:hypothetical protein